jgi:release factor glutamine methyltransferase
MNIQEALSKARALALSHLDATLLLAYVLQVDRAFLFAHGEHALSLAQQQSFLSHVAQRKQGYPLAYIIGTKAFWRFELQVNESVLIPRPETELLVQLALDRMAANVALRVADLGTGSGAIALALALERPLCQIDAVEQSAAALRVAQSNCAALGLGNVCCYQGRWCEALGTEVSYAVIVSNPPYIDAHDACLQDDGLFYEPREALVAQEGGLADIVEIVQSAQAHLIKEGWLLLEHGADQGALVRQCFMKHGYQSVATKQDLAGLDRVTMGRSMS